MKNEENGQRPAQTEGKTRIPGWFVVVIFVIFSLSNIITYYGTKNQVQEKYIIERIHSIAAYNKLLKSTTECMNLVIYLNDEDCITTDSIQKIEVIKRRDLILQYADSSLVEIKFVIDVIDKN